MIVPGRQACPHRLAVGSLRKSGNPVFRVGVRSLKYCRDLSARLSGPSTRADGIPQALSSSFNSAFAGHVQVDDRGRGYTRTAEGSDHPLFRLPAVRRENRMSLAPRLPAGSILALGLSIESMIHVAFANHGAAVKQCGQQRCRPEQGIGHHRSRAPRGKERRRGRRLV
jgi:hypothetical protein